MNEYTRMSVADVITSLGKSLMQELDIPGETTEAILTFAIDVVREDVYYYPTDILDSFVAEPERCSFCRKTAERLFNLLGAEPVEHEYEFNSSESDSGLQKRQASVLAVKLARQIRESRLAAKREVLWIKYANHEFVVVVRNRRAEILQCFQAHYGSGHGLKIAKSLADGELELCLALMASGRDEAAHAQKIIFGRTLSAEMSKEVFAYSKATLFDDDRVVERLRGHMRASLVYYKELAARSNVSSRE
jgi:hypothetical protein